MVRPWKAFSAQMIACAPPRWIFPHFRASFTAVSFASAPEFTKKTRSAQEWATRSSASSICGRV